MARIPNWAWSVIIFFYILLHMVPCQPLELTGEWTWGDIRGWRSLKGRGSICDGQTGLNYQRQVAYLVEHLTRSRFGKPVFKSRSDLSLYLPSCCKANNLKVPEKFQLVNVYFVKFLFLYCFHEVFKIAYTCRRKMQVFFFCFLFLMQVYRIGALPFINTNFPVD